MKKLLFALFALVLFGACTIPPETEPIAETQQAISVDFQDVPSCAVDADCQAGYTCEGFSGDPDPNTLHCVGPACDSSQDCDTTIPNSVAAEVCAKYLPAYPFAGGLHCVRSVFTYHATTDAECKDHDPHAWLRSNSGVDWCASANNKNCVGDNTAAAGIDCSNGGKSTDVCCGDSSFDVYCASSCNSGDFEFASH